MVYDPHELIAADGFDHECLCCIGRKINLPSRTREAKSRRTGAGNDRNGAEERPVLLKHIEPVVGAITRVHQPVLPDNDAMRMSATQRCKLTRARPGAAIWRKKLPLL